MKIIESQLKRLIREHITRMLQEAEVRKPTLIGTVTFGELKKADIEAAAARGNYQDPETGKTYPATSLFQRVKMNVKDNAKVEIFQSVLQYYTAILNPDGDGSLQYVIGRDTVNKLGLNKPQAPAQPAQVKGTTAGATAGLPPRNLAEAKLRNIIKQELRKVVNENFGDKESQLRAMHFNHIPEMDNFAKNLEGHVEDNGDWAVVTGGKYYHLSARHNADMKRGQHHNETFDRIMSLINSLGLQREINSLPARPY